MNPKEKNTTDSQLNLIWHAAGLLNVPDTLEDFEISNPTIFATLRNMSSDDASLDPESENEVTDAELLWEIAEVENGEQMADGPDSDGWEDEELQEKLAALAENEGDDLKDEPWLPFHVRRKKLKTGKTLIYCSMTKTMTNDMVITLGDWYHVPAPSAGRVPTPTSTLINGKGRYAGGRALALSIINVTIIEVDGVDITPLTVVDNLRIFASQCYSFVLTANQPVNNYWMRAEPNLGTTGFIDPMTSRTPFVNPMFETNLHPLVNLAANRLPVKGGVDYANHFAITFAGGKFNVNSTSFVLPTVPVLLQIMSGAMTPGSILPAGSMYYLPANQDIELSFSGGGPGFPHPLHLHGHTFSVVRSARSSVYNYDNPVRRDVVSAGAVGDNVTIRFRTDNPGPWILHCHIDWHFEIGLAIVFAEDTLTVNIADPPAAWDDLCPIYNAMDPGDL
ncbi:hypothetical protein D9615_006802 [Tricholomella constricta]|uniref:laccase n=1 Tax=Tricholomella constricta TaxID=117010 RepID=A0A8H5M1Z2_9AGAR|nr:hypothetical protein D9615_006802 [Tricholomella constricta]